MLVELLPGLFVDVHRHRMRADLGSHQQLLCQLPLIQSLDSDLHAQHLLAYGGTRRKIRPLHYCSRMDALFDGLQISLYCRQNPPPPFPAPLGWQPAQPKLTMCNEVRDWQ